MQLKLKKRPKGAVIIEGFPGFGLVGTITTEFLIGHLDAEPIGYIRMEEVPPVIAFHRGEPVEPLGIFYSKKKNVLILHALNNVQGFEWELSNMLIKLADDLNAKEIISIEGVGNPELVDEPRAFYTSYNKKFKTLDSVQPLKEGIIMGVTGALLVKKDARITAIFAETHSGLPDSRAAAKIVEVLDDYLDLRVDYKPLLEKAEKFEEKLKDMMEKTKAATKTSNDKKLTYMG